MAFLQTYSARNVLINYAGVILNSGRPEDTFLTISENAPRASFRKGLSGDTSSALSPDHSVTITLTFFPESRSAQALSLIYNGLKDSERFGNPVLGAVPMVISDPSGSTFVAAGEVVMFNKTETGLGADTGSISFEFYAEEAFQVAVGAELNEEANKGLRELGVQV